MSVETTGSEQLLERGGHQKYGSRPMRSISLPLVFVLLMPACSDPPEEVTITPEPESTAFDASGLRCLYIAPEGELLSCEEISVAGIDQKSARENCALLNGRLERAECPTEGVVGRCLAMDGPDLEPVYAIRITHYRSSLVPSSERSRQLCADLNGTFVPAL